MLTWDGGCKWPTGRTQVATPREELMDKIIYVDAEISYKREEFGLPVAGEE